MPINPELGPFPDSCERLAERRFGVGGELKIADRATVRADQVMVMMVGEGLCKLVSGVVIVRDNANDGADLFKNREVAIHARLGEARVEFEDPEDRDRSVSLVQCRNDAPTPRCVAMVASAEQGRNIVVQQIGAHSPYRIASENR